MNVLDGFGWYVAALCCVLTAWLTHSTLPVIGLLVLWPLMLRRDRA